MTPTAQNSVMVSRVDGWGLAGLIQKNKVLYEYIDE